MRVRSAFLRNDVVQFELAHLDVEPGAAEQVVQPRIDRFKVEMRRSHPKTGTNKKEIFLSSVPPGKDIEAANVKTVGGDLLLSGRGLVDGHLVGAFAVPLGRDAHGDRPVAVVLPDRSIPIIHQLVAVVLELLAKVVEHRPGFVAGGAAQAIFSREGGKGVRVADRKERE